MNNTGLELKKKRILLIGPVYPYRGGIAHFTTALAEELKQSGQSVDIISYKWQYPAFLYPGKSDKDHSPNRQKPDADYILSSLNPLDWQKTFRKIQELKPDLVIFQWWVSIWAPAYHSLFKKLNKANIPFKLLVHNTYPHETKGMDKKLAHFALKHAKDFIAMTQREANKLQELLQKEVRVQIVPHPIYQAFPSSGLSKEEARANLGLLPNVPVILFFGFVRAYKGLDLAIESIAELKKRNKDAQLLVAGEFWEDLGKYQKQIADLGIQDYVKIVADYIPDDQASQYFEASDCFIAPYRDATQSGSVKLAMGYALPVVVSDVVADDFLRQMKDDCWVVPTENIPLLCDALEACLKQTKAGKTAQNVIKETWRAFIQAIIA
ncbi:MAG: glycosyltransferase [Chloroflexi bacterium]|nr:glycosyltransferase [Chloroflexota bacterium]